MSLINEALKRAKQIPARPLAAVASEPALQPVVSSGEGAALRFGWLLPAGVVLLLLLAFGCFWLWWRQSHAFHASATVIQAAPAVKSPIISSNTAAPLPSPQTVAMSEPKLAPLSNAIVSVPSSAPQAGTSNSIGVAATPAAIPFSATNLPLPAVEEPAPANLHLQGIFYRTAKASTFINGQTLFVGDEIEGAKVLAIERQSVRLLVNGKNIVLKLH
jgi:hypothetical protein